MPAIRVNAAVALGLLALYYIFRFAAQQCSGAACDTYIWPSAFLPIGVIVIAGNTGRLAVSSARRDARAWVAPLIAATLVGVLGPVVAATVFRDQPDVVVPLATVLFLSTPLAALGYSFRKSPSPLP